MAGSFKTCYSLQTDLGLVSLQHLRTGKPFLPPILRLHPRHRSEGALGADICSPKKGGQSLPPCGHLGSCSSPGQTAQMPRSLRLNAVSEMLGVKKKKKKSQALFPFLFVGPAVPSQYRQAQGKKPCRWLRQKAEGWSWGGSGAHGWNSS